MPAKSMMKYQGDALPLSRNACNWGTAEHEAQRAVVPPARPVARQRAGPASALLNARDPRPAAQVARLKASPVLARPNNTQ
jgi:hypothetical protein